MLNVSTMPPKVRRVIYYLFAIAGLAFGATEIAIGDPHWLNVAMTVLSFVGSSIGVTAGIHTGTTKAPDGIEKPADTQGENAPVSASDTQGVQSSQTVTPKRAEVPSSPTSTAPSDASPAAIDGEVIDLDQLPEPDGGEGGASEVIGAPAPAATNEVAGI